MSELCSLLYILYEEAVADNNFVAFPHIYQGINVLWWSTNSTTRHSFKMYTIIIKGPQENEWIKSLNEDSL